MVVMRIYATVVASRTGSSRVDVDHPMTSDDWFTRA
jgi:hypothetical protein